MSGSTSKRYPAELRERAVRMVVEIRADHESEWAAMTKVAELLGVGTPETIRKWCRQTEVDAGPTGLIAHHDHGVQYMSVAYSERLDAAGIKPSTGAVGSSYDCEQNQGLPGRGLTLAYDWPRCLGVDLSARPGGDQRTRRLAGRAVTE